MDRIKILHSTANLIRGDDHDFMPVPGSETLSELSENQIATFWTRKLPAVNGTDLTVTEDVAPVVQYILNNSKYAGIIDHNSLAALDAYCKSNGYKLTGTIDDDSTLR